LRGDTETHQRGCQGQKKSKGGPVNKEKLWGTAQKKGVAYQHRGRDDVDSRSGYSGVE